MILKNPRGPKGARRNKKGTNTQKEKQTREKKEKEDRKKTKKTEKGAAENHCGLWRPKEKFPAGRPFFLPTKAIFLQIYFQKVTSDVAAHVAP